MIRIDDLIEQTTFLLEKQKDSQQDCLAIFQDLLAAAKEKLGQIRSENPEEAEHLEQVCVLISDQKENISEDSQVDIDFLTEQLQALQKIQAMEDSEKARLLLNMIVDENEEMKDTESFKKEINEEAAISKQNLLTVINDLKEAIKEGSAEDVATYLGSIMSGEGDDQDGDDFDDEDGEHDDEDGCDDEEEEGGSCGGCKGCGTGGGCGSGCGDKEVDIFADLAQYEKEFFKDTNDKIKH